MQLVSAGQAAQQVLKDSTHGPLLSSRALLLQQPILRVSEGSFPVSLPSLFPEGTHNHEGGTEKRTPNRSCFLVAVRRGRRKKSRLEELTSQRMRCHLGTNGEQRVKVNQDQKRGQGQGGLVQPPNYTGNRRTQLDHFHAWV